LGVGLTTPPWKRLVTKSEEAIAGYWQKLLRKARAHVALSSNDDDDDDDGTIVKLSQKLSKFQRHDVHTEFQEN
jgi:hypothetical protein